MSVCNVSCQFFVEKLHIGPVCLSCLDSLFSMCQNWLAFNWEMMNNSSQMSFMDIFFQNDEKLHVSLIPEMCISFVQLGFRKDEAAYFNMHL